MYRKRHKRGKRLASVFLTVALITATVPVQAAEFGTPDSFEEIFSSGEEDSCITDTENTLPAASDSEKVMASELSPTPTVTSTPEGTPMHCLQHRLLRSHRCRLQHRLLQSHHHHLQRRRLIRRKR